MNLKSPAMLATTTVFSNGEGAKFPIALMSDHVEVAVFKSGILTVSQSPTLPVKNAVLPVIVNADPEDDIVGQLHVGLKESTTRLQGDAKQRRFVAIPKRRR